MDNMTKYIHIFDICLYNSLSPILLVVTRWQCNQVMKKPISGHAGSMCYAYQYGSVCCMVNKSLIPKESLMVYFPWSKTGIVCQHGRKRLTYPIILTVNVVVCVASYMILNPTDNWEKIFDFWEESTQKKVSVLVIKTHKRCIFAKDYNSKTE